MAEPRGALRGSGGEGRSPTLLLLAAGRSRRYGSPKQLEPVGPGGATLADYVLFDAARAGFGRAVVVVSPELREPVRRHVAQLTGGRFPVTLAVQRLDDLPEGRSAPEGRRRPWGTGHAVLAAAELLGQPFAVANADDVYGPSALRLVAAHLEEAAPTAAGDGPPDLSVVGYALEETLRGEGPASRAVLEADDEGRVRDVTELLGVERREGVLSGRTAEGRRRDLSGREPISRNLWGFHPPLLPLLEERFRAFLDAAGEDPEAEFFLSDAVGHLLRDGRVSLRLLPAPEPSFGITYPEDARRVRARLGDLVDGGTYPADLPSAFRRLGPWVADPDGDA